MLPQALSVRPGLFVRVLNPVLLCSITVSLTDGGRDPVSGTNRPNARRVVVALLSRVRVSVMCCRAPSEVPPAVGSPVSRSCVVVPLLVVTLILARLRTVLVPAGLCARIPRHVV